MLPNVPHRLPPDGGLRFLAGLLTRPPASGVESPLEALLLEAELDLVLRGRAEARWSAWLSAAEAFHADLCEVDRRLVGTPRDILNRWALNGGYFLELDEAADRLRIHAPHLPLEDGGEGAGDPRPT